MTNSANISFASCRSCTRSLYRLYLEDPWLIDVRITEARNENDAMSTWGCVRFKWETLSNTFESASTRQWVSWKRGSFPLLFEKLCFDKATLSLDISTNRRCLFRTSSAVQKKAFQERLTTPPKTLLRPSTSVTVENDLLLYASLVVADSCRKSYDTCMKNTLAKEGHLLEWETMSDGPP